MASYPQPHSEVDRHIPAATMICPTSSECPATVSLDATDPENDPENDPVLVRSHHVLALNNAVVSQEGLGESHMVHPTCRQPSGRVQPVRGESQLASSWIRPRELSSPSTCLRHSPRLVERLKGDNVMGEEGNDGEHI